FALYVVLRNALVAQVGCNSAQNNQQGKYPGRLEKSIGSSSTYQHNGPRNGISNGDAKSCRSAISQKPYSHGGNKFENIAGNAIPIFKVDDSIRDQQAQKLQALRSSRDAQKVRAALESIRTHAVDGTNLMPSVVQAVEDLCTLGEIADVLRTVFGEYK
ncbi:MAG: hypothetical protein EOO10_14550, partial [Chitinophagaceae bacterium]